MRDRQKRSARLRGAGVVLSLVCGALALGCTGTRLVSGGPFAGVVQTPEGTVRYSLAKTVVVVEATVTKGASGKVTFDGNEFAVDTKLVRTDAKAQVSLNAVVDEDQFFTLRLEHGDASDDGFSVELAPNGLLRSVGLASSSQIGATIRNVTTIAASVVAGVVAATLSADPRKKAAALVCEQLASEAGTPGRCPALQAITPGASASAERAPSPAPRRRTPTLQRRSRRPRRSRDVTNAPRPRSAISRWRTSISSRARRNIAASGSTCARPKGVLLERSCKRAELERTAERATGKPLEDLRVRITSHRDLEYAARLDLRTASEELDLAVRRFQLETGIDGPRRTEVVRVTFDLDDIPPPDMLRRAALAEAPARVAGMADAEVRKALESFPRMLDLYDRTGIALTLTPPPYAARGGTVWSSDSTGPAPTRIYYRPSYTAVLTTYSTSRTADEQGGVQELLRLFSVASDDVVHRKMPMMGFTFAPEDFAERRVSIAFDAMGRLARFDQTGRSAAAGELRRRRGRSERPRRIREHPHPHRRHPGRPAPPHAERRHHRDRSPDEAARAPRRPPGALRHPRQLRSGPGKEAHRRPARPRPVEALARRGEGSPRGGRRARRQRQRRGPGPARPPVPRRGGGQTADPAPPT